MKTHVIHQMASAEFASVRAWHKRMIGRDCQCKPCRAEIAAEREARKATIDALIGSIEFGQAAEIIRPLSELSAEIRASIQAAESAGAR